jgi:hypothetical protein
MSGEKSWKKRYYKKAVFERFVAFCILFTELIVAEGARSSKMHPHFLRAVFTQGSLFKVLRE